MRNRIITNSLRTIKTYFPRFLSLLIMSMLGCFVFCGLSATSPDMMNTLDKYLSDYNTYDMKIVSTMGLTHSDIDYLKKIKGIKDVEGFYSYDILVNLIDKAVINVTSIPKSINKLELTSGEIPNKNNEILVEDNLLKINNLKLGDTIELDSDIFDNTSFKIVGTVNSSLYFNSIKTNPNRGKTSVGAGEINYYAYVLDTNFNTDYYTNIYITFKDKYMTGSNNYVNLVNSQKKSLEKIKSEREKSRYDEIYSEALTKVKENEESTNRKFEDALNTLNNYKSELEGAKYSLDSAKLELDNNENKLNSVKVELEYSKQELDSKASDLEKFKEELDSSKEQLDQKTSEYNNTLSIYNINEDEIDSKILEINANIETLENLINNIDEDSEEFLIYKSKLNELHNTLELLNKLSETGKLIKSYQEQYEANLNLYLESSKKLEESYASYNKGLDEYNSALNKLNESKKTYQDNLNNYYSSINEYNYNLDNYNSEKLSAEGKIKDAYNSLEDINMPKWYIYDRTNYSTYIEYLDDTNSIKNLSKIFPILFFAVAILISLISMNRMVEDDRNEIGTLKSLGFSNRHILNKYLIFSFFATLIGVFIGSILGIIIIPKIIFAIYKVLFELPDLILGLNLKNSIIGLFIALLCICGTTIYTTEKVLKEKPSELIRPKAPKNGKRILFERLKIWKRLKFSRKVTIRNIFRYKKRVLVTIFGIAGCASLIVCGFGIKDSIVDIASTQYGKIFKYDALLYVNDNIDDNVLDKKEIIDYTKAENINAKVNNTEVVMFITETGEELSNIVNLYDKEKNIVSTEKGKVLISEKFAKLNKLNIGDKVKITDTDNNIYEYEISNIVENHIGHYIFMDKYTYELSNQKYKNNVIYLNTKNLSNKEKNILSSRLLENDNIINIVFISDMVKSVLNMLESLDQVILILIVLASLLAFVVLYNLSNINIHERKREIATLKVLGFYNREVDNYITKENIFLSVVGIIIGLVLGYFLTNIVITTVEIEKARFLRGISINSYINSSIIAITFTLIVNIFTHFSLKKIDMIESLKSVE